jgi:glycerate kinase
MEAVGLVRRVEAADLVITGEGAFDASSLRGKVPAGVLEIARAAGVPALVLCGRAEIRPPGLEVHALAELVGPERAVADARLALEEAAAAIAARVGGEVERR